MYYHRFHRDINPKVELNLHLKSLEKELFQLMKSKKRLL